MLGFCISPAVDPVSTKTSCMESHSPTFLGAKTKLESTFPTQQSLEKLSLWKCAHWCVLWAAALPPCISEQASQAGGTPWLNTSHKMPSLLPTPSAQDSQGILAEGWTSDTASLNSFLASSSSIPKRMKGVIAFWAQRLSWVTLRILTLSSSNMCIPRKIIREQKVRLPSTCNPSPQTITCAKSRGLLFHLSSQFLAQILSCEVFTLMALNITHRTGK